MVNSPNVLMFAYHCMPATKIPFLLPFPNQNKIETSCDCMSLSGYVYQR